MSLARGALFSLNRSMLTLSQKAKLAYYLLTAIKSLHDRGVAHCDIKLENILLYKKFEDLSLTDFGAAIKKEDADTGMSQQMSIFCMDPECLEKTDSTFEDLQALDIWQAALIISEVFGPHPLYGLFPAQTSELTMDQLREVFPTVEEGWYSQKYKDALSEQYSETPAIIDPLVALLNQMLHPKRSERPGIDECIARIADLIPKRLDAES